MFARRLLCVLQFGRLVPAFVAPGACGISAVYVSIHVGWNSIEIKWSARAVVCSHDNVNSVYGPNCLAQVDTLL